ncbi:hypothetical protein L7F22_010844 [Adiantum nelumboides]|nr:hypothetical protein [Adiantum nelumboides]
MRPCLSNAVRLQAFEFSQADLQEAKWFVLNGYGLYKEELLERAMYFAKKTVVQVAMVLSSFEFMRIYCSCFMKLLSSQQIDLYFANEDESQELMHG